MQNIDWTFCIKCFCLLCCIFISYLTKLEIMCCKTDNQCSMMMQESRLLNLKQCEIPNYLPTGHKPGMKLKLCIQLLVALADILVHFTAFILIFEFNLSAADLATEYTHQTFVIFILTDFGFGD